jgi:hypothetical protein
VLKGRPAAVEAVAAAEAVSMTASMVEEVVVTPTPTMRRQ